MNHDVVRATLLVVLSACCFGSISTLTIIAVDGGMPLQAVQAWRYATTAVLLVMLAAWRTRIRANVANIANDQVIAGLRTSTKGAAAWYAPRMLIVAGGGQAIIATLALMALRWIPAATEAFLFYTFPAWVALITATRGLERIDRVRGAALVLALTGVAIMVGAPDSASLHPAGVAMALSAALVYAFYIPLLDSLQKASPPLDVARAIAVGGSVVFLVWAIGTGTLFVHANAVTVGASVLQGVLSTGAFLGFLAGLARLGAVRTAITSTIEPFWTAILGVAVLRQPIGVETYAGGVAIMGAVLLLQRPVVAPDGLHSSVVHEVDHSGRPQP